MKRLTTYIDYEAVSSEFDKFGLSNLQKMRLIGICHVISIKNEDNRVAYGSKYTSADLLSSYYKDYSMILDRIEGNDVISFEYNHYKNAQGDERINPVRLATINPKYLIESGITINLKDNDYRHLIAGQIKVSKYGNNHSSNEGISVDCTYDEFREVVPKYLRNKHPEKDDYQLELDLAIQWNTIRKINKTGKINPRKPKDGRCSSRITLLSSPLDKFIFIDGEQTCLFDQHATYLTLLPQVLESRVSKELQDEEFKAELAKFRNMILKESNIYEYISRTINVDMLIIKKEVNKFFCDPKAQRTYDYKFFEFFQQEFPNLNEKMLLLRTKRGPYSEFNRIESYIFSGASRELNKLGIKAITKYDALIVKYKDREKALEILEHRFSKANTTMKIKTKIGKTEKTRQENIKNIKTQENREPENKNNTPENIESTGAAEHPLGREPEGLRASGVGTLLLPDLADFRLSVQTQDTPRQRNRSSKITIRKDGRFRTSIKNRQVNSRKNETLEEFETRIENM